MRRRGCSSAKRRGAVSLPGSSVGAATTLPVRAAGDGPGQPTVRLLITDVGVGKTIEAALIHASCSVRGTVRRLGVLCPPYLCEQWQAELAEKFHIEAVVIHGHGHPTGTPDTPGSLNLCPLPPLRRQH